MRTSFWRATRKATLKTTLRATLMGAVAALTLAAALAPRPAAAAWPDRNITILVIFAPGGSNDLLGRLIAAELSPVLGQSVIVENRPGANGNIGLTAGARATPDGYTLIVASGVVEINPSVSKTAYDPIKDFEPIAYLGASPNMIVTAPSTGITSLPDLIAKAKAAPGKINFSSPGVGSVSQLAVELLKLRTGINLQHVPYSGAAPALQAALSGTTEIGSVNVAGLISHIQAGTLKALVQTGAERWPDLPDTPTMAEAGIPNAEVETNQMFLAPAGTPKEIVDRLAAETKKILEKPDVREKMLKASFAVKYEGPAELKARIAREVPMWKDIVDRSGIRKE